MQYVDYTAQRRNVGYLDAYGIHGSVLLDSLHHDLGLGLAVFSFYGVGNKAMVKESNKKYRTAPLCLELPK